MITVRCRLGRGLGVTEHQVTHPHVSMADGVEASTCNNKEIILPRVAGKDLLYHFGIIMSTEHHCASNEDQSQAKEAKFRALGYKEFSTLCAQQILWQDYK